MKLPASGKNLTGAAEQKIKKCISKPKFECRITTEKEVEPGAVLLADTAKRQREVKNEKPVMQHKRV